MSSAQNHEDSINAVLRSIVEEIERFPEWLRDEIRQAYAKDAEVLWSRFSVCTFGGLTNLWELQDEFCSARPLTPADAVKAATINRVLCKNGRRFLSAEVDDVWPEVTQATIELIKARFARVGSDLEAEMKRREARAQKHNADLEIAYLEEERDFGSSAE
jgi:hypothetical protein